VGAATAPTPSMFVVLDIAGAGQGLEAG